MEGLKENIFTDYDSKMTEEGFDFTDEGSLYGDTQWKADLELNREEELGKLRRDAIDYQSMIIEQESKSQLCDKRPNSFKFADLISEQNNLISSLRNPMEGTKIPPDDSYSIPGGDTMSFTSESDRYDGIEDFITIRSGSSALSDLSEGTIYSDHTENIDINTHSHYNSAKKDHKKHKKARNQKTKTESTKNKKILEVVNYRGLKALEELEMSIGNNHSIYSMLCERLANSNPSGENNLKNALSEVLRKIEKEHQLVEQVKLVWEANLGQIRKKGINLTPYDKKRILREFELVEQKLQESRDLI